MLMLLNYISKMVKNDFFYLIYNKEAAKKK